MPAAQLCDVASRVEDRHPPVAAERAHPLERRNAACLDEAGKTPPELVNDVLLAGLTRSEVQHRLLGADTELLRRRNRAVHRRGLEQLLRRDATAVQAGTADLLLLDESDRQPRTCAVQGGGVAPGTAADDDEVEGFLIAA